MALTFPRTFANLTTALLSYLDDDFNYIANLFGAANGFASLDSGSLLLQNAPAGFTIGGKAVSATPAANTVPVRNSSGDINGGPGLVGALSAVTTTTTTDLDLGTVITGDLFFVQSLINADTGTIALPFILNQITKLAGTAIIVTADGANNITATALSGLNSQNYTNTVSGIIKVAAGGTLTLRSYTSTGGTVGANRIGVFFIKKQ